MSVTIHTRKFVPLIKNKEKIYAIKMLKDDTKLPLRSCKNIIDDLELRIQNSDVPEYLEYDIQHKHARVVHNLSEIPDSGFIKRYDNSVSNTKIIFIFIIIIICVIIGFFVIR